MMITDKFVSLSPNKVAEFIDEEANRRSADHKCWMTIDLCDGEVVTLVWFGTTAKMLKLQRQLETLPRVELAFRSRNTNGEALSTSLYTRFKRKRGRAKRKATK
jgi:hypothetical protein